MRFTRPGALKILGFAWNSCSNREVNSLLFMKSRIVMDGSRRWSVISAGLLDRACTDYEFRSLATGHRSFTRGTSPTIPSPLQSADERMGAGFAAPDSAPMAGRD